MSSAATWQVTPGTGDFGWGYPLRTPPALNGPAPQLEVGYSSQSVDGRTSATNNQTSWVGEGWSLESGYVQRAYVPCADDMTDGNNDVKTGDLCWDGQRLTIVVNGQANEIVQDSGSGEFRLKNDDGSRLDHLTGGTGDDDNDEYWRLTTTDGVRYYFGLGHRLGDGAATGSVWTVPVFGNQPWEPCYASAYASSWCQQGWRWNLDYVVDPNNNSMSYFYATETNKYGRNLNKSVSTYDRGGYLSRIEYGTRHGGTVAAPSRVDFGVAERCIPTETFDCSWDQLNEANADRWPDVPYDQVCTNTTSCPDRVSPTFFSRKRLTGVSTKVWNGTSYSPVDAWTFDHSFPSSGDT
ncbi:MAG: hypothetical protein ACRDUA_22865, partial [Micromonosporaceae bacterium]